MKTTLFMVSAVVATFYFMLMALFDIWVYRSTKNLDFVLSVWMNRHKGTDQRLLPKQAALLRVICFTERGLKYFFYFVFIPIAALLVFFIFNEAQ